MRRSAAPRRQITTTSGTEPRRGLQTEPSSAFTPTRDDLGDLQRGRVRLSSAAHRQLQSRSPKWSPDGTRIAFSATARTARPIDEIYVLDARQRKSSTQARRDNSAADDAPDWSPDGSQLDLRSARPEFRAPTFGHADATRTAAAETPARDHAAADSGLVARSRHGSCLAQVSRTSTPWRLTVATMQTRARWRPAIVHPTKPGLAAAAGQHSLEARAPQAAPPVPRPAGARGAAMHGAESHARPAARLRVVQPAAAGSPNLTSRRRATAAPPSPSRRGSVRMDVIVGAPDHPTTPTSRSASGSRT